MRTCIHAHTYIDFLMTVLSVVDRYNSLADPCHVRRENLEDALHMYQFFRDVEDELSWIQDRKPIAESTDLGNSLTAVQNLMKKHQVGRDCLSAETQIAGCPQAVSAEAFK